ncbi:MAG: GNAT family N-acetyltransferase [Longimicrobiales bacterium]|nr:GNAT family N-acetyltransferase [Longimicrobiales bacterium]
MTEFSVKPGYRPPGADEETGVFLLRDGSRVPVWRALSEDARRIEAFLRSLGRDETDEVARSLHLDPEEMDDFLRSIGEASGGSASAARGGSGPTPAEGAGEGFVVEETEGDTLVGFAAYRRVDGAGGPSGGGERNAVVTLAVAPGWRDRGMGHLLLERIARMAASRGVRQLRGTVGKGNRPVLDLFRDSGLDVEREETSDGVTLSVDLSRAIPEREHPEDIAAGAFAAASLRPLFRPRSVAVVGASREPGSVGHRILVGLLDGDFQGTVYPVNPNADHVASIRAWPSISAIEGDVDLAVVAVPAHIVPSVVDDCADAGVEGLIVISAGFAETGEEGRERQKALLEQVRKHGMRTVGPNCLGLLHTDPEVRLNASFAPRMPPEGSVALCSQSGALGIAIIALARRLELGLSSFVSVGNQADVAADDLLEYWEEDPGTEILLFYLESFVRPRRFARIARRVGRSKPIVVVKSGRSEAGGRAAGSHTAALAGSDVAVDALFDQTGVLRAETLEEMFGIARGLATQPLPRGRSFGIVTNSGGPAILCADALEAAGLSVDRLPEETREELSAFLPAAASKQNPVDMIASAGPEEYRRAVETVLACDEIDGLVVIYTPVGMFDTEKIAEAVADGVRAARAGASADGGADESDEPVGAAHKPVYASIVGGDEQRYSLGTEPLIPVFTFPEEIGRVAGAAARHAEWTASDPGAFPEFGDQRLEEARSLCRDILEERGEGWLSVEESRRVLEMAGLTVAPGGVGRSANEAVEIAREVGFPVAAKLASIQITHKTDLGAVKLDLEDESAVRSAFSEIEEILEREGKKGQMEGVLIQPMLEGSAEVMAGMSQDPVFGPVLAFGLGGIYVEVLRDVAFRVAPLTDRDAREMVREIRGWQLLQGYRGHPEADVEALEEALLRLSLLVDAVEEIRELDLNPIFALEPDEGYRIADARIRVKGR